MTDKYMDKYKVTPKAGEERPGRTSAEAARMRQRGMPEGTEP